MMDEFFRELMDHAKAEYPKEACGLITDKYIPCKNISSKPEVAFEIHPNEYAPFLKDGSLKAVVHSHTGLSNGPGVLDMKTQMEFNVPFGITYCHPEPITPYFWGPGVAIPPLLARQFRHGPSGSDGKGDCYAAIKDWYKLKKDIDLPEFPRDDEWWNEGGNLYTEGFAKAGFKCIFEGPNFRGNLKEGSVILFRIVGKVPHHGAVYLGNELIFHHLADTKRKTRLSKEDPLTRYRTFATHWLEYSP